MSERRAPLGRRRSTGMVATMTAGLALTVRRHVDLRLTASAVCRAR